MKRLLLAAAVTFAPAAYAQQWNYDERDVEEQIVQMQDEIDRLADDDRVVDYAREELAIAEQFVGDLSAERPGAVSERDLIEAERLIGAVEAAARIGDDDAYVGPRDPYDDDRGREVLIVEDEYQEGDVRDARRVAEDERAAADAARREAEHERAANARLRAELGQAQTRVTDRGLVLTLGDVLFSVGKSDLKPGAARTLDKLVVAMKRDRETRVTIEGHTDSTGGRAFNIDLSKRRAAAVRGYLTRKGITTDRIVARGLGPDYPVATNATDAGRQQNRRVEVLVQNDDGGE